MVTVLMVVAPKDFRDEELLEPKKVFEGHGYEVVVASKGVETAKGMLGAEVSVDTDISQVQAEEFNAVVFVGGPGSSQYFEDRLMHAIARRMAEAGKPVAAICIAPAILAEAGILKGKKFTVFPSEKSRIEKKGGKFEDKPVVTDGNVVTACGPKAARAFAEAVVKLLETTQTNPIERETHKEGEGRHRRKRGGKY